MGWAKPFEVAEEVVSDCLGTDARISVTMKAGNERLDGPYEMHPYESCLTGNPHLPPKWRVGRAKFSFRSSFSRTVTCSGLIRAGPPYSITSSARPISGNGVQENRSTPQVRVRSQGHVKILIT